MKAVAYFRAQALKGPHMLTVAAKHNRRDGIVAADNIDPGRSHMNFRLRGPATVAELSDLSASLMAAAGITRIRTDAVRAIEVVVSLPQFNSIDPAEYFERCVCWVAGKFGGESNILSADVHLDESNPHCHVLVLPLVQGKLNGSKLLGSPGKRRQREEDFFSEVAEPFGLSRPPVWLVGTLKAEATSKVVAEFERDFQSACETCFPAILAGIQDRPDRYLPLLGLKVQKRPLIELAISPGKGPRTAASAARQDARMNDARRNRLPAIGARGNPTPTDPSITEAKPAGLKDSGGDAHCLNEQSRTCVGFTSAGVQKSSVQQYLHVRRRVVGELGVEGGIVGSADSVQPSGDYTRPRESEQPVEYWNAILGESGSPPLPAVGGKAWAIAQVAAMHLHSQQVAAKEMEGEAA